MMNAPSAYSQFKFREPPNRQNPENLSEYNEQVLWSNFQAARYIGNFALEGSLKYRPARNESTTYYFQLNGNWNSVEQESELHLSGQDEVSLNRKVVIRNGQIFLQETTGQCVEERALAEDELSGHLVEGLPFTWIDILMPYLKWTNVTYLGPDRYLGRPAHRYILINENANASPAKVIVTLDEDFAVLLKSDVLDKDDNIIKRIRVSGFRQFGDEWMFSELVWEHRDSRESVLLKVSGFVLNP